MGHQSDEPKCSATMSSNKLASSSICKSLGLVLLVIWCLSSGAASAPSGIEDAVVSAVVAVGGTLPASSSSSSKASKSHQGMAVELDELLAPETATENGTVHRVTVQIGETVLLPCKAYSLGRRTVSWVRRRDWHIMSSGTTVYTADSRFNVLNRPGSPDWILMLKSPQLHDSGTYECQIVGGHGQVSQYVELLVWSPLAVIGEGGEHHVEAESTIQLHCQLRPDVPEPANSSTSALHQIAVPKAGSGTPFVWYHNGRPLSDGLKSAGGLGTVRIEETSADSTDMTSRLEIERADQADSGNYTCSPWRGRPASVSVFVSQGDKPAAVQRQAALRSSIPLNVLIFGLNFLLVHVR